MRNAQASSLLSVSIAGAVTAQTSTPIADAIGARTCALHAAFAYGSGGTTVKGWVQTTIDGVNWIDIASFTFTTSAAKKVLTLDSVAVTTSYTPTDGTLADDTAKNGILGSQFRVKYTTTGTYAGATTLTISMILKR